MKDESDQSDPWTVAGGKGLGWSQRWGFGGKVMEPEDGGGGGGGTAF